MKQLSHFKKIDHVSQIKETDFLVVLFISHMSPEYAGMDKNVITFNKKQYVASPVKGMYRSFIEKSKSFLSDPDLKNKFPDYEIAIAGQRGDIIELFAYKNMQALIEENLVYSNDVKCDFEIDNEAVILALNTKQKFYSPSNN